MSLDHLPEAPNSMWHKVNGVAMTRSVVTGEPLLTKCGKKMSRFNHAGTGSGRRGGAELPDCPDCEAITAHEQSLREEWRQDMEHARRVF